MTSFAFPLQKVLEWRRTQLELEEAQLRRQTAALVAIDRTRAEVQAVAVKTETEVRRWDPVSGSDLAALGDFRRQVHAQEQALAVRRAECAQQVERQQAAMLEARRRCRLLERLRERRLAEWTAARDREL